MQRANLKLGSQPPLMRVNDGTKAELPTVVGKSIEVGGF